MAARRTPQPRREPRPQVKGIPERNRPKNKPLTGPRVASAQAALTASFGTGDAKTPAMDAVMGYYQGLPRKQRRAALQQLYSNIQNRDLSQWSGDPGNIALFGDISMEARKAYALQDPRRNGTLAAGGVAAQDSIGGTPGEFATGVSGATNQFITEFGQSQYAAGEATGGATTRKKKAQRKKLVKRVVKKTNVKGKAVRKALRTPGVTKADQKVYKRVAKQATPKLSSRLRRADRRGK